ncbi:prostaglandin E2 receptor EP4 subtype-like [Aplysia californica]|uniref:Prostaglandin E2 receptor EP4 subtype-like n=1 Tax=Aplysia californica TaxID=6500 RepID=A0ABM0JR88_APLCA|nr:prostaglandin E2 receptor EP4 subtype-like [Aplysia californica]
MGNPAKFHSNTSFIMINSTDNFTFFEQNSVPFFFLNDQDGISNSTDVVSSEIIYYVRHILYTSAAVICGFGIVFNVIILCVFCRQGFAECVHISLVGLAVSDLLVLSLSLLYRPFSWYLEIWFGEEPTELLHAGGWLVLGLAINSSSLAVFICVERCLCIALPFKVKEIITPKVTLIAVVAIFVVAIGTVVPSLFALRFGYRRDSTNNATVLNLYFTEHYVILTYISYVLATPLQISSLICLCVVTLALIIFLTQHQRSRQGFLRSSTTATTPTTSTTTTAAAVAATTTAANSNSGNSNSSSTSSSVKERRLIRMVVLLSSVILLCFLPAQMSSVATLIEPEFSGQGRYGKLYRLCWGVAYFLYAVNSSINVFVYYSMSSKFKKTLRSMLGLK